MRKIIYLSLALIVTSAQSILYGCCRVYEVNPKSFSENNFGKHWDTFYQALQKKCKILASKESPLSGSEVMDDDIRKASKQLSFVTIRNNGLQQIESVPGKLAYLQPLAYVENTSENRMLEFTDRFLTNIFSPDNITKMLVSLEKKNLLTHRCVQEIFSTPPSFIVVEQDHPTELGRVTLRAYVNPCGWSKWAYWNFCASLSEIKSFVGNCAYGTYSGVCNICSNTLGAGNYCIQQTGKNICSGCSWTWSNLTAKNLVRLSLVILVMALLYEGIIYHELLWQECVNTITPLLDEASTYYSTLTSKLFPAGINQLPDQCQAYLNAPLNLISNPIKILLENFDKEAQSVIHLCIETLANHNKALKVYHGIPYKEFIVSLHRQLVEAGAITMANYLQSAKLLASNHLAM